MLVSRDTEREVLPKLDSNRPFSPKPLDMTDISYWLMKSGISVVESDYKEFEKSIHTKFTPITQTTTTSPFLFTRRSNNHFSNLLKLLLPKANNRIWNWFVDDLKFQNKSKPLTTQNNYQYGFDSIREIHE